MSARITTQTSWTQQQFSINRNGRHKLAGIEDLPSLPCFCWSFLRLLVHKMATVLRMLQGIKRWALMRASVSLLRTITGVLLPALRCPSPRPSIVRRWPAIGRKLEDAWVFSGRTKLRTFYFRRVT